MSEIKQCQNCKQNFLIEDEDFAFYQKIDVPAPTWCPECRMIRRMAWRNVRNLYKIPCKAPGHKEQILSIYSSDKPLKVFDRDYWWSDKWDPLEHGKPYDFSKPFFKQYAELFAAVPHANLSNVNAVETEYANMTLDSRRCYLVFSGTENEDCLYGEGITKCRDCVDIGSTRECEWCYECMYCERCHRVSFSQRSYDCMDSAFLFDCRNCRNCFGCHNLRNKEYHLFNQPYSRAEYEKEIQKWWDGSRVFLERSNVKFQKRLPSVLRKFASITASNDATGDQVSNSTRLRSCFDVSHNEDSKYVYRMFNKATDNYDISVSVSSERAYECAGGGSGYNIFFCTSLLYNHDILYSHQCFNCANMFGCIGVRNREYCILNKQYSREEYKALVPKIIQHMNDMLFVGHEGRTYRYGEFFPIELSPFAYNESWAHEYFPIQKEQVLNRGLSWRNEEERNHRFTKRPSELPERIADTPDSILQDVIGCEHEGKCSEQCTGAFRVIKPELEFYRTMNIPLPRLCPSCRFHQRIQQRNPLKLWHRQCMCNYKVYRNSSQHSHHPTGRCPNEFETPYAPDRPEVIYCEACYNAEVA